MTYEKYNDCSYCICPIDPNSCRLNKNNFRESDSGRNDIYFRIAISKGISSNKSYSCCLIKIRNQIKGQLSRCLLIRLAPIEIT